MCVVLLCKLRVTSIMKGHRLSSLQCQVRHTPNKHKTYVKHTSTWHTQNTHPTNTKTLIHPTHTNTKTGADVPEPPAAKKAKQNITPTIRFLEAYKRTDGKHDVEAAKEDAKGILAQLDPTYADTQLKAAMFSNVAGKWATKGGSDTSSK